MYLFGDFDYQASVIIRKHIEINLTTEISTKCDVIRQNQSKVGNIDFKIVK